MILWGRIQDFPIFAVLQFLAQYRKSGVLEIQDFEEFGSIYLTAGRVDAISLPLSDDLLGRRLVAAGFCQRSSCASACWSTTPTTRNRWSALLHRGYTDQSTLRRS